MTYALDAIRARHVPRPRRPEAETDARGDLIHDVDLTPVCSQDGRKWPCDTATVLAALDEERLGAETEGAAVVLALGAKIVAAEAREARLRDELRDAYIALAALDESYTALATTPEADA